MNPKINLTGQNITRTVKKGWFYLRIDSVIVANDVTSTESYLLNISESSSMVLHERGGRLDYPDWRLRGERR